MINASESCSDASNITFGLFDFSIAPALLFYSYIPIILIALFLAIYVLRKDNFSLRSKLLFVISSSFSLLLLNEIILWIAAPVSLVMFGWEWVPVLRIIFIISVIYFVYVFLKNRDVPFSLKVFFGFIFSIILLLLPTTVNIQYFDLTNCEGVTGVLWSFINLFGFLSALIISWIIFTNYRNNNSSIESKQGILVGISSLILLLIFSGTNTWGDVTKFYDVTLTTPLGMIIFLSTITFIIVKYRAFNTKLATPISLVFVLWILVFSLLFIHNINQVTIIVSLTLMLITLVGFALIESVRNDIKSREKIEGLVADLAKANIRLKELDKQKSEFVSIASHQLRSPLTAISGYASLLKEGSYGKLPARAEEPIERIYTSARAMSQSVEEYLNVSRIESGNMKYVMVDFNLRDEVERICDDLRPIALKKGLLLFFRTDISGRAIVNADKGKLVQAVHNLINNSIKYTEKGTVTIYLHDTKDKIFMEVNDTGIGMSEDTKSIIFNKFKRAENAHKVNIQGTGLGLYMALKITEAMGGTITAHSEGEGKGSRFILELPLVS